MVELIRRELGIELYPEQIDGGIALLRGKIIEMATGEGKTLTAVGPAALRALVGKGCHVLTSNDYLAKRDAELAEQILSRAGISVGCIQAGMEQENRAQAYKCNLTFGTCSEFGFDFLRDRLVVGPSSSKTYKFHRFDSDARVQRELFYAIVDEADDTLIDDAGTPLLISMEKAAAPETVSLLSWAHEVASQLELGSDFLLENKNAALTEYGERRVLLRARPEQLASYSHEHCLTQIEKSLVAQRTMQLNRDYAVTDDGVQIVCPSTGRILEGRKWKDGLHQAVETKERVSISEATATAATITLQEYFRRYKFLAGMTGTARSAKKEFKKYYKLDVQLIPTHKPTIRQPLPPRVFLTQEHKFDAIVLSIREVLNTRRAVLIGTPSIATSLSLSAHLKAAGIEHVVLNALQNSHEARIVAEAGQPRRVTVATNMAGRGTDIKLHPTVSRSGGLHVIGTELHNSHRIDRQLIGRAARQGDPGSFQFLLSLEDEFLTQFPNDLAERLRSRARSNAETGQISSRWIHLFQKLQDRLQRKDEKLRLKVFKQATERIKQCSQAGFDPCLEIVDSD